MKTKLKDLLLYSLSTIGVVALFISATQTQVSQTTPESHVWQMSPVSDTGGVYMFNKVTGEVRKYAKSASVSTRMDGAYIVAYEIDAKR